MEELRELVKLVSAYKIKGFDLFRSEKEKVSKMETLYNLLSHQTNIDESEIIKKLNYASQYDKAFEKLKQRLIRRLTNAILLMDPENENFSDLANAYYKVSKSWIVGLLLINRNLRKLALPIIKKAYAQSIKYEFTEYAYLIANEMKKHYAYINPDNRKFNFYLKEVAKLRIILNNEILAEDYYSVLSNLYITQRSSKLKEIKLMANKYAYELMNMQKEVKSYKFNSRAFEIASFSHMLQNRYEEAINVCKQAILFFQSKPLFNLSVISLYQKDIATYYIKLGKYKEAKKYVLRNIDLNIELQKEGSFNWFDIMSYYFIVSSFQKDNETLFEITSQVTQHKNLSTYNTHYQAWRIKEAYIHFLIKAGKIKDPEAHPLRPFRLGRFLNEVPLYSKDKRGLNISILIVQILFYILDRKLSKIDEKLDALNQYCYRYLRNDETLRSNCFIKMLLKLPEAAYHPIRAKRYVDKYYKRLTETPINVSEQGAELEIIPYEYLWEIVVELLEKKK